MTASNLQSIIFGKKCTNNYYLFCRRKFYIFFSYNIKINYCYKCYNYSFKYFSIKSKTHLYKKVVFSCSIIYMIPIGNLSLIYTNKT